jgi:hypothetical protein
VVAKVWERLAVNKHDSREFIRRCSITRSLKDVKGKEQFHVEVSNRFAALEDLDAEVEINSAWDIIRETITISAKKNLGYC